MIYNITDVHILFEIIKFLFKILLDLLKKCFDENLIKKLKIKIKPLLDYHF